MPPTGFQPANPANDRPHTLALDRTAIGIGRFDCPGRSESPYRLSHPCQRLVIVIVAFLCFESSHVLVISPESVIQEV